METSNPFLVIAVYRFVGLDGLPERRARIRGLCRDWGLKGTVLLAPEGVNAFLAGAPEAIARFKDLLRAETGLDDLVYKESWSEREPFERMLVKIKKEIIPLGEPSIRPAERAAPAIAPSELRRLLDEGKEVVLLDTRNRYEIEGGTFEGAVSLEVDSFRDFGRLVREGSAELRERWKDRPIVMFCTGGIRCEKAGALLMEEGFQDVRQLEGGILNYFEKEGGAHYRGNCFVFDWRLAVDPALKPVVRTEDSPVEAGRHRISPEAGPA